MLILTPFFIALYNLLSNVLFVICMRINSSCNMKRKYLIYIILIFCIGCGPYIWFKVPQPEGFNNLKSFPDNIQGKYISLADTSTIRIESEEIVQEYRENLIMTKIEFREETGDTIPTDTSFAFADKWDVKVMSIGDSVYVYSRKDEQLFKISDRNILREYKGYYFLNYKDSTAYWKVKILKLYNDTLEFDYILTEDDIVNIVSITTVESVKDTTEDVIKYYLQPSKRQLKKILKRRSQGEKFIKID